MKLTFELNDAHIEVLSRWASVGRTLDAAAHIARALEETTNDPSLKERAEYFLTEYHMLKTPLDSLHHAARSAIWESQITTKPATA